jgi:hypothetical protein
MVYGFDSSHMRTSDIADASDTVGQDFDRSDISIHEAQPALRRTARVCIAHVFSNP